MQNVQTVFFVGKPGCGKGTQAELLATYTGWPVFSSGTLFRELSSEDTPLGHMLEEEVNKGGKLGPPWLAMYLYLRSLFSIDANQSAIFDGFNRKIPEAEIIVDSLKWFGRAFSIVYLDISDEVAEQRIALRKQTSGREDDKSVPERLEEYKKFTKDAVEVFRNAGVLVTINGEQSTEAIAADIRKALHIA